MTSTNFSISSVNTCALADAREAPVRAQQSHPELEFRNFGADLETTKQIARRLNDDAVGADWIVKQGRINGVVGRTSPDETVANLRGMVMGSLEKQLAEIFPWNKGHDGSESILRQLNARIRQLGREESVQVLPFYQTPDDPEFTGQMRPERTDDGNHPSQTGHRHLGEIPFSWPTQPTMEAI